MKAYVDSSVALRILLHAPNSLASWNEIDVHITSALLFRKQPDRRTDFEPPRPIEVDIAAVALLRKDRDAQ